MTKPAHRSRHWWILAAAIVTAPLLPGCTPAPSDLAINRIAAKPVTLTHVVHFAPGSSALAASEAASLHDFLLPNGRNGVAGATIVASNDPLAAARSVRISHALDTFGIVHTVAPAGANTAADTVLVTVNREIASAPPCPSWGRIGTYDPSNGTMRNLGCATANDLYRMVADPRDLVSGQTPGPADAAPSMRAVEAYRTGDQKVNPQIPSMGNSITGLGTNGGGGGGGGQ